jgi:hypothetical protein
MPLYKGTVPQAKDGSGLVYCLSKGSICLGGTLLFLWYHICFTVWIAFL